MLEVRDLRAGYDGSTVLHGVALRVRSGEIVALLGRNGSGRSTTARAIMGLLPWSGRIQWDGVDLAGRKTFELARLGLGYVPESRDVFPGLSVQENLVLGQQPSKAAQRAPGWSFDDCYRAFPALAARSTAPAGALSGGEQQMLSLCRALMGNPRLLVADEPTEGLAPQAAEQVANCLRTLRDRGVAVLLIEQKLTIARSLADRVLVMGQGRIVFEGSPDALDDAGATSRQWLLP